ncbi:MAG: HAD family hydrolase [Coriobacteriales bacterium]
MRGILFDLDGTLLDINLGAFLERYFRALAAASRPVFKEGLDEARFMSAINAGTARMMDVHPGRTNQEVFAEAFRDGTGLDFDSVWPLFECFYAEVFPTLRDGAGPAAGAREAVEAALGCGLGVVIATNPIFPRVAIEERLRWARLDDLRLDHITDYETMTSCKPHGEYFTQALHMMKLGPTECMMVGDDRYLDMSAADIGLLTFYVGDSPDAVADFRGTLEDLARLIPRLVATSDADG